MSSSSWQISRTKHRRKTATPTERKSARRSNIDDVTLSNHKHRAKRQSTLTQIDFVKSTLPQPKYDDEELEALVSPPRSTARKSKLKDNTLTQMGIWSGDGAEPTVHFDDTMIGSDDQENRVWVNGSLSDKESKAAKSASDRKRRRPLKETQERRPKRRKSNRDESIDEKRRSPVKPENSPARPPLVVRDSTDYVEPRVPLETQHLSTPRPPVTPKRRKEVPSSQSPESIKSTLSKRKICVLKLRQSNASPKPLCKEDSQHDLWSLQPTSPPTAVKVPRAKPTVKYGKPATRSGSKTNVLLGDSSEAGRPQFLAQDSLPDLAELVGSAATPLRNKSKDTPTSSKRVSTPRQRSAAKVRPANEIVPLSEDVMLLDVEPTDLRPWNGRDEGRPEYSQEMNADDIAEDDDDLGPAVANDTQFATDLIERLSSPSSKVAGPAPLKLIETTNQISKGSARSTTSSRCAETPAVPIPRLVPSTTKSHSSSDHITSTRGSPLTSSRHDRNETVTRIPLNDIAPIPSSSTQPASSQQIFPASIPHPSQISTQAPSQGFLPSSSTGHTDIQRQDSAVERITIYDSSSSRSHHRGSSGHDLFLPQVDDSEDEEIDLGVTMPHHRSKPANQDRSEDETQTPTQRHKSFLQSQRPQQSLTQESPIILRATTRSQRDRELEVVPLLSSPVSPQKQSNADALPVDRFRNSSPSPSRCYPSQPKVQAAQSPKQVGPTTPTDNGISNRSLMSSSPARPNTTSRKHLEGFNNETQSDYTQGGHITAAFVHKCWEDGTIPRTFVPKPYKTGSGKW